MNINKVTAVYFSATGNTKKIVTAVAAKMAEVLGAELAEVNIANPAARESKQVFGEGQVAVIGVPTYAGKTPNKLLPYLQEGFVGAGAVAVPVVTFGNRSFDNSLAELVSVMAGNGFGIAGAGAFACRHAFTDLLADGRPNADDLVQAAELGEKAAGKIAAAGAPADLAEIEVPGDADAPYYIPKGVDGQPAKFLKAKPLTDMTKCGECGACARKCPMGSINPENVSEVTGVCIKCQACIRGCMKGAKYFDDEAFLSHVKMLEQNFAQPLKDNEICV